MIKLRNNTITLVDELIDSASYTIELDADVSLHTLFGVITFSDGCEKIVAFTELPNLKRYKAKLTITEEELQALANVKLKILVVSEGGFQRVSNTVNLPVDITKVKQNVKVAVSKEVKNLKLQIQKLESQINTLLSGKVLENINIINKDYIKKGMIPVALDDKGNFVATYPFNNLITKVNGQEALDGLVEIDASMIKYKQDKTIYETLGFIINAINALNTSVQTITNTQKDLREQLNAVTLELERNKNNGII